MCSLARKALIAALLLPACAEPDPVTVTVPEGVDWLAVFAVSSTTSHLEGTLRDVRQVEALTLLRPEDGGILALGYVDALEFSLAREGTAVRSLDGCGPALPGPLTRLELNAGDTDFRSRPGIAPRVGADICAAPADWEAIPRDIRGRGCGLLMRRTAACEVQFTDRCGIELVPSPLTIRGELCMLAETDALCRPLEPREFAFGAAECTTTQATRLQLDFFLPGPPPLTVTATRSLLGDRSAFTGREHPVWLSRLYIADMEVLGEELLLVDRADVSEATCTFDTRPTNLVFLNREDLSTVRTATAPPCLMETTPHPSGGGFFAVFTGPTPMIGHLDRQGRVLGSAPIANAPADFSVSHRIAGLVASELGGWVVVAAYAMTGESTLWFWDLSLGTAESFTAPEYTSALAAGPDGRLAISGSGLWIFTPATGEIARIPGFNERANGLSAQPVGHPTRSGWVVSEGVDASLLRRVLPVGSEYEVGPGVGSHLPFATTPMGHLRLVRDRPLEVVAFLRAPSSSVFAVADLEAGVFLPGHLVFGGGAVTRLVEDGRGGALALLPGRALLVRLALSE